MSKLHRDGHALPEPDTRKGELRKPDDRDDQPGQGADLTPPERDVADGDAAAPRPPRQS
jgi:hypothetical protein